MTVPSTIFREYDIRGVVPTQLSTEVAREVGRAFAHQAAGRLGRSPRIAVARDNRPSGTELAPALAEGLVERGAHVIDVGVLPTPALYYATQVREVDGGIQVTGSHNPPEFNGFKMVLGGESFHGAAIQQLYQLIVGSDLPTGSGSRTADGSILEAYIAEIVALNGPLPRPVRVAIDCGNGTASLAAVRVLEALGAEVVPLYCNSDGTFPNHHPDPTVPENLVDLQAAVRRSGAELGIAFDGDGDRIGAVDEVGRIIYGDLLLILFARDLVERGGRGQSVVFDVKCSSVLPEQLRASGLTPIMWKTGHSLIKAKMRETGAALAGEMSGHMFFAGDYRGFDDALFAAARLVAFVARAGGPLSIHLQDLPPTVSTPEIRLECPDEKKFAIVAAAADYFAARYPVDRLDGARISFPDGWGLVRASNTQPVLVLRFEASSERRLADARQEVEAWLAAQGVG